MNSKKILSNSFYHVKSYFITNVTYSLHKYILSSCFYISLKHDKTALWVINIFNQILTPSFLKLVNMQICLIFLQKKKKIALAGNYICTKVNLKSCETYLLDHMEGWKKNLAKKVENIIFTNFHSTKIASIKLVTNWCPFLDSWERRKSRVSKAQKSRKLWIWQRFSSLYMVMIILW